MHLQTIIEPFRIKSRVRDATALLEALDDVEV